jgi:hypothetical protein
VLGRDREPRDDAGDAGDDQETTRTSGKIDKDVSETVVVEPERSWIKQESEGQSGAAKKKPFGAFRRSAMPHAEDHAQGELRQPANGEAAENPQPMLGINEKHDIARRESEGAGEEQETPWPDFLGAPKEQGKDQIKLNQHGEVPPGGIEVHEVHRDIDEAQSEQAQDNATVHGLETRDERREEVNQMRDPVHGIKT